VRLEECLVVLDAILATDVVGARDAEKAIAAFNTAICSPGFQSTFEQWGDAVGVLTAVDDAEDFADLTEAEIEEEWRHRRKYSSEEWGREHLYLERFLARLILSGSFDPENEEHLQAVRDELWTWLGRDGAEPAWQPASTPPEY